MSVNACGHTQVYPMEIKKIIVLFISPVNMFLHDKRSYMSKNVLILTIEPQEISGVKVDHTSFTPFG